MHGPISGRAGSSSPSCGRQAQDPSWPAGPASGLRESQGGDRQPQQKEQAYFFHPSETTTSKKPWLSEFQRRCGDGGFRPKPALSGGEGTERSKRLSDNSHHHRPWTQSGRSEIIDTSNPSRAIGANSFDGYSSNTRLCQGREDVWVCLRVSTRSHPNGKSTELIPSLFLAWC
jgi:hypothetical protein